MKKVISIILAVVVVAACFCGFSAVNSGSTTDKENTIAIGDKLAENQPTPTDIDYSLECYNLIRRTYWVNGQREKANSLVCEIEKPFGKL